MSGQIRIIGGRWKGQRLTVPARPGLRPTPDRLRETLFNWLMLQVPGSRCLDLFAGTGALGLEAASRGAKQVVMIDNNRQTLQHLQQQIARFADDSVHTVCMDALRWLHQSPTPFDVVFLDPPFRQGLLHRCCTQLESGGWLMPDARVYLEAERELGEPELPANWQIIRRQQAGQVACFLVGRQSVKQT